jgi:cytochrome c-type biogenesis protein CcmH
MFIVGCILLALLAFVFAVWRGAERQEDDRQAALLALYRARKEELEAEVAEAGAVAELREDLDAALLDDWVDTPQTGQGGRAAATWTVAAAIVAVLLAGVVYWRIGDPTAGDLIGVQAVLHGDLEAAELELWGDRLGARVRARPQDAQSWYLKGLVGLQTADYSAAAEAFAQANAIQGNDPSIDMYWLQARYMAANGRLDGLSVKIAERLLEANPGNATVLELLAVERFRAADYPQALSLLNRALSGSRNVERQVALVQMMDQVRVHMPAGEGPGINVAVRAASGAPTDATVFVVARPVGGGMPFAVVRRPALLLPFDVRLDDYVSMNPALPLSSTQQVEVVVRLSRSGQAMAAAGDWQWTSAPVDLSAGEAPALEAVLEPPAQGAGGGR